ncbi:MAG: CBS domain-containing protein, partial [Candidatus Izemoplasmatales bacterium]|nr:CBS domain-containing protein [Candidatus Izemoplasmatales bacterium]
MENVITNPFQAQVISILESVLDTDEKRNQLDLFHDYELAQSLLEMDERQRLTFYSLFSDSQLAQIIAQLPPLEVRPLLQNMSKKLLMSMLNQMQTDDLVDIIESIEPEEDRLVWLAYISPKRRNEVLGLLDFDPALVGSIMNPNFIAIKRADTVKSAIKKMVDQAPYTEFINNLFVLEEGRLVGVLSLKEIISAGHRPTDLIEDIMTTNIITVTPWTSNEEAIELMKNYDFLLLPVVDQKRKLLGIIAFDDMFEALNKESDEDYSKLAGLTEISIDEDRENVFSSVRKRMPWLV